MAARWRIAASSSPESRVTGRGTLDDLLRGRAVVGQVIRSIWGRVSSRAVAQDPDCLFCRIVAGELPSTIVDEDERTIAFMDINPATRGHALVVPRQHSR